MTVTGWNEPPEPAVTATPPTPPTLPTPPPFSAPAVGDASAELAQARSTLIESRRVRHRRLLVFGAAAIVLIVCAALAFVLFAGGGDEVRSHTRVVSKAEFGQRWPLTVEKGELRCDKGAVTIVVDGKPYALNAKAQNRHLGGALGPLWAPNPKLEGARMSTGELIGQGLKLC